VGAIATQAMININYGSKGIGLLESGLSAPDVLRVMISEDPQREVRQAAIVDASGKVAAHTGKECLNWAGHVIGRGYSCQGNILANSKVVESMAQAYEETPGDLIDRLMAAISAGQAAGGDRRGQQSAAILVVREKGGYEGFTDRYVDLRVDDHPHPIEELKRVLKVYDITMLSREDPRNLLTINHDLAVVIQRDLKKLGMYDGAITGTLDDGTRKALEDWVNVNNFENRMREQGRIWRSIVNCMEEQARAQRNQ